MCALFRRLYSDIDSPSIILDGEMLVWDPVSGRNLPFGTLKTAALGRFILMGTDRRINSSQINPRKS